VVTPEAVAGAPLSFRAYGRHRKALGLPGGNPVAVSRAVKTQRLVESLVVVDGEPKITDPAKADEEWARNTDLSKAPATVKAQAAGVTASRVTSASVTRRGGRGNSLAEASTREKNARADLAELEYRAKAGELVPARAVETAWSDMVTQMRTAVLSVPSKFKTLEPDLTHTQLAHLNDLLVQALEGIANTAALDQARGPVQ
jgi:phage terminase Nu1 subunit (DNA packaging protein)